MVGILAKTKMVSRLKEWIEGNIISIIPGYNFFKGMGETAAGLSYQELKEVLLVDVEEVWQIGFLMQGIGKDLNTVFYFEKYTFIGWK